MSMNRDSDQFEQLRRLLVLKRHEQPPPGYFYRFSGQVIARIQAGDQGDGMSASSWFAFHAGVLQRFWASLEARPILTGALGVLVCGFFITGVALSERVETALVDDKSPLLIGQNFAPAPKQTQYDLVSQRAESALAGTALIERPSTTPVGTMQSAASLFDSIRHQGQLQMINFSPGN